jgi:hypothetical protein
MVFPTGKAEGASFVTAGVPQLSSAIGVPKFTPDAEHCPLLAFTVTPKGQRMVGNRASVTVTVKLHVATPQLFVAVTTTLVIPTLKVVPEFFE